MDVKLGRIFVGSPFCRTTDQIIDAAGRAGGTAIVDIASEHDIERIVDLARWSPRPFGVHVRRAAGLAGRLDSVGEHILFVASKLSDAPQYTARFRALVEVTSRAEAREAAQLGASGLIVRGSESGYRGGTASTFLLLQQVLDDQDSLPIWAAGGIGPHSAAGAIVGGATGVLLDTQLSFFPESHLSPDEKARLNASVARDTTGVVEIDGNALAWGEDLAFAKQLSSRYQRAFDLIRDVRRQIDSCLSSEAAFASSLEPNSPGAQALGVRLPLVQGPMARVSDVPDFAREVGNHGALPTIALAMLSAEDVTALASATSEAMGRSPWGIGLLGFLPQGMYRSQLDALDPSCVSVAVVAGGRLSQQRELEQSGVSTFLHVPSPVLLQQFVSQGAKRFIFEGSECGGDIGPHSSFVLWDMQVAVLLDHLGDDTDASDLCVLFAGGISSARSAAMVAAIAAPLITRGVAIGLQVGTAYTLTAEAVSSHAVTPTFQARLLGAGGTSVLETGPGHAIRCVESPFVDEFEAEKNRLANDGIDSATVARRLEELDLGRLRLAAKGQERVHGELVDAPRDRQESAGMFMAGEIVSLYDQPLTIAALHEQLTVGAADFARCRIAELAKGEVRNTRPQPERLEIAVVGMACAFAGAPDLDAYWQLIMHGTDGIGPVPKRRWNPSLYLDAEDGVPQVTDAVGGFLDAQLVDPALFGIPPASFAQIDPAQILALDVSYRALDDAGLAQDNPWRQRTAVIFGAESGSDLGNRLSLRTHLPALLGYLPRNVDQYLPSLTSDTFPGALANIIAGRVANRLDLGGANYTVDAACASSLAALDAACDSLRSGASDVALAGGVDLHNAVGDYAMFSSVGALSASGTCRPFDADADGIVLGEGVACVVLKRLSDAEAAGDRIYCVIEAIASSSDGRSQGLTAPRTSGQVLAMERALDQAHIDASEVELIEAHGTGTQVGDTSELRALSLAYPPISGYQRTLGSVKAQIGHTKCAAGLASFVKTALAIHKRILPLTKNTDHPVDADYASGFVFRAEPAPWLTNTVRRGAISAFGFGGTNFHVIAREHAKQLLPKSPAWTGGPQLVLVRGQNIADAVEQATDKLQLAHRDGISEVADLARMLASSAGDAPVQMAIVADSIGEIDAALDAAADGREREGTSCIRRRDAAPGQVAILFPGQGSQRPGMFEELGAAFPDLIVDLDVDPGLADLMYPGRPADSTTALTQTENAQPALGLTDLLAHRLLERSGIKADMYAGHSYGEIVALTAAGALQQRDLLAVSRARADAILDAYRSGTDPGSMLAISASAPDVAERIAAADYADVVIANFNGPQEIVVSGPVEQIASLNLALQQEGISARRLNVSCAFHHPALATSVPTFETSLRDNIRSTAAIPVWSNTSAQPFENEDISAAVAAAIAQPVRFSDEIEAMWEAGARVFIEAGPGKVLSTLVDRILAGKEHLAIGFETAERGVAGFLRLLARLSVEGVELDPTWLADAPKPGYAPSQVAQYVDGAGSFGQHEPPPDIWPSGRDSFLTLTSDSRPPVGSSPTSAAPRVGESRTASPEDTQITFVEEEIMPGRAETSAIDAQQTLGTPDGAAFNGAPGVAALTQQFMQVTADMQQSMERVLLHVIDGPGARSEERFSAPIQTLTAPTFTTPVDAPAPDSLQAQSSWYEDFTTVDDTPHDEATTTLDGAEPSFRSEPVGSATVSVDVESVVREVIAERTGYSVEMIEPSLDLEADLSIDSIKRLEIAGELVTQCGLDPNELPPDAIEDLSQARTVTAITAWIEETKGQGAQASSRSDADNADDAEGGDTPKAEGSDTEPDPPQRYVPATVDMPGRADDDDHVRSYIIFSNNAGIADALRHELETLPRCDTVATSGLDDHVDAPSGDPGATAVVYVIDEDSLQTTAVPMAYDSIRSALLSSAVSRVLSVRIESKDPTRLWAAGMSGLIKTAAKEFPHKDVRMVTLADAPSASETVAVIREELSFAPDVVDAVRSSDGRRATALITSELGVSVDGASTPRLAGGVVLFYGGARGIGSQVALHLVEALGVRLELAGSTPAPSADMEEFDAATTAKELRAAVARARGVGIRDTEALVRRISAQREIRETLALIRESGEASYEQVDVRDAAAVAAHYQSTVAKHGRVDGVIFASGINRDQLIVHTSQQEFERVFRTKADGIRSVLNAIDRADSVPQVVVAFGSIAAVDGNPGQVGYTAANDAMETLLAAWGIRTNTRTITVNWGAWAPRGRRPGMVSPELERDFLRRGMKLLDGDASARALINELQYGPDGQYSIVLTPEGWVTETDKAGMAGHE